MKTFDFIQSAISHNLKDPHSKALEPDCLSPPLAIMTQSLEGGGDGSCLFLNALFLFYPCLFDDNPLCWLNNDILYIYSDPCRLDLTIEEYPGGLLNDQGYCFLIEFLPFVGIGGAPCRI